MKGVTFPWPLLQMVSAERVIEYSKLRPEAPLTTPTGKEQPPQSWPHNGAIHLHQMKLRYAEDTPYILKDISVDIHAGEKVRRYNIIYVYKS